MIVTERLVLRRARADDLGDLHRTLSDPQAMRYWDTRSHVSVEQTRQWLAAMIAADPLVCDDFVVERDGRVIGKAGCWRLPWIGYILRPDQWGQGLGREAVTAVVTHLFARHRIAAVLAEADPRNTASLRLLASLGFRETARVANAAWIGGEWTDSVYLALPRPS